MSELEHGGAVLGRIHAKANHRKALAYWLGFLRGVLASDCVEELEVAPLVAEAQTFLGQFPPEIARLMIRDLIDLRGGETERAYVTIESILANRSNEMVLDQPKDQVNEFYGFCAGIACDNRITPAEVERLIGRLTPELLEDDRIASLKRAAALAIRDGRVTPEESDDVCAWITRLVGDSASDTGLGTFGNVGVVDRAVEDPDQVVFDGRMFVLTGKFAIGPRKAVAAMITDRGGAFKNTVCGKTDYLAIAAEASRDWKRSHEGRKIIHAMELRRRGGLPNLVLEPVLERALVAAPDPAPPGLS